MQPIRELNENSSEELRKAFKRSNGKIALVVHPNFDKSAGGFADYKRRLNALLKSFDGPVVFWSDEAGVDLREFEGVKERAFFIPTLAETPIPDADWMKRFKPEDFEPLAGAYGRLLARGVRPREARSLMVGSLAAVADGLHELGARRVWLGGQYLNTKRRKRLFNKEVLTRHSLCVGWVRNAFQEHSPRFKVVSAMPGVSTDKG